MWSSTHTFILFTSIFCCVVSGEGPRCPIGQYTKATPSAESGMKACKEYSCDSCCSANLTAQLAQLPLQVVGGLNYSQCGGGLSAICSQYMSYIQCFYQCSPNLYPWLGKDGRMYNLPLCGSFCDEWFAVCMSDKSCVQGTDWVRGFQEVPDPNNKGKVILQCKTGQPCRNFSQIYGTSQNFCNQMWPGSVVYTSDEDNCINPAGTPTSNEQVFKAVAGEDAVYTVCEEVTYIDTGAIIGIVIGCLAGLALICGVIMFCIRNKQKQKEPAKKEPKEQGKPKELEELHPAPPLE